MGRPIVAAEITVARARRDDQPVVSQLAAARQLDRVASGVHAADFVEHDPNVAHSRKDRADRTGDIGW